MGGNARVNNIGADRIDFNVINRWEFANEITLGLNAINTAFFNTHGCGVWNNPPDNIMSGSSSLLFEKGIKDYELLKWKPTMGDIDVMCPDNKRERFSEILVDHTWFNSMQYVGRVESEMGSQIITVMYMPKFKIHIQMDFEFVEYSRQNIPSYWGRFCRSSHILDIQHGIKGVFHKYLIGSLDFGYQEEALVFTPALRKSSMKIIHHYAFSVGRGLRKKYRKLTEEELERVGLNNRKIAYVELKTENSEYITSPYKICQSLLRRPNASNKTYKNFDSFCGIVEIVSKLSERKQKEIFNEFITRCWGKGAQQLYRNDPIKDSDDKGNAVKYFIDNCPKISESSDLLLKELISEYYKDYK